MEILHNNSTIFLIQVSFEPLESKAVSPENPMPIRVLRGLLTSYLILWGDRTYIYLLIKRYCTSLNLLLYIYYILGK